MREVLLWNWCAVVPDADRVSAGEEGSYSEVLQGGVAGAGELCRILPGDDSFPHLLPG